MREATVKAPDGDSSDNGAVAGDLPPTFKTSSVFVALCAFSIISYVICAYLLALIVRHFPRVAPFVFVDTHGSVSLSLWSAAIQPGGFMAVLLLCLAFDVASLGFDRSALRRLLAGTSASTRTDLFYMALRMTGGINLLAFVFSFGSIFWLANQIHRVLHIGVLQHVHSYIVQFAVVYLLNTFLAYWGHRFMHTRWMWELHKVHHSADEMNLVTPFRNHPIDLIINSLLNAFAVAVLGASAGVVIVYYAVNMMYQSLVHSEIVLKGQWWDKIWITPAAHRIHHSNRIEHWNANFGIVAIWDRLFGTYRSPTNEKLQYGVEDSADFNRPDHLSEVFDNVRRWLAPICPGRNQQEQLTISSLLKGFPAAKPIEARLPASIPVSQLSLTPAPPRSAESPTQNLEPVRTS